MIFHIKENSSIIHQQFSKVWLLKYGKNDTITIASKYLINSFYRPPSVFYDNITSSGFMPQIILPSRLSETCNTLIDNIILQITLRKIIKTL